MVRSADEWVFAYGSLMWRPEFVYAEARRARLADYHRAFCVYSVHYRGSPGRPGLVLGLDRGGACEGLAFRLPASLAADTLRYLRERELIYGVYREALVAVTLLGEPRGEVLARAFVAERAHRAYAGPLPLVRQVQLIRGARGAKGANLDYLINTVIHLRELGIRERGLERLLALAGAFAAREQSNGDGRARARALAAAWSRVPAHGLPAMRRAPCFTYRRPRG
jgi:cation transport protein ChaC